MLDPFVAAQRHHQTRCEVCEAEVPWSLARLKKNQGYVVCQSLECQRIMKHKPAVNAGFFKRQVENRRLVRQTRIAIEAAEIRRVEELQTREEKENEKVRQSIAKRIPGLPEQTRLINLPSGLSKLSAPPDARIAKYKAHLWKNVLDASQFSSAAELTDYIELKERDKCLAMERKLDSNPELRIISDQLCGTCKGGCCVLGKDHAFITVSTIRRFMDANPTLTKEEVMAAYLDRIDPETVDGSCINHTKRGCGLPRETRSDTCNGFYCAEIKTFHREFSGSNCKVDELITVQRAHTLWDRWATDASHEIVSVQLVDKDKVKQFDLTKLSGTCGMADSGSEQC